MSRNLKSCRLTVYLYESAAEVNQRLFLWEVVWWKGQSRLFVYFYKQSDTFLLKADFFYRIKVTEVSVGLCKCISQCVSVCALCLKKILEVIHCPLATLPENFSFLYLHCKDWSHTQRLKIQTFYYNSGFYYYRVETYQWENVVHDCDTLCAFFLFS